MNNRSLFILVALFIWFSGHVFWFDLIEEISSEFKKYYDWGYSDSYLEALYLDVYSKDPYWDELKNVSEMSMQKKIAWVEYVEEALSTNNCSLNQKKLWAILYYFVPEFRAEIAKNMKMELWESSSRKFVFDEDTVLWYCREYYQNCVLSNKGGSADDAWNGTITASTPENIKTNCQEFFQRSYREWQANEERVQNLQLSQLGADKYWNGTVDDSPYDVMFDISTQWELSFEDVEQVLTPVLYDIPVFNKSKDKILNKSKNNSNNNRNTWRGWSSAWNRWGTNSRSSEWWDIWSSSSSASLWWWNTSAWSASLWWNWWTTNAESDSSSPTPLPTDGRWFSMEWWYDDLIDGLWAYSVVRNNSLYYWSLCEDEEEEPEPEEEPIDVTAVRSPTWPWRNLENLSDEELQEVIDSLQEALDSVNPSLHWALKESWWSTFSSSSRWWDPEREQEKIRNEILTCMESCDELNRLDQRASCKLMCACWEKKASIFDPEKHPGLWPIYVIRYCTVPAVDMRFSVWWKRVMSIEEMVNEIHWVVDKLSREWKLWTWTQQRNFLDSTTKLMKVADTFAFSIDVEFVDISNQLRNYSTQYRELISNDDNEKSLQNYGISNSLNNLGLKNKFRIIWQWWSTVKWYAASANPDVNRQKAAELDIAPTASVDLNEFSREQRYVTFSDFIDKWLDMQADFWQKSKGYLEDMTSYAKTLNAKRK